MLYNVIPIIKKVKITNFFCIDLFSFYTGIVMTSLAYFVAYCIIKRNKPVINNQIVLPGLCSGILWGIANVGFLCFKIFNNIIINLF